MSETTKKPTRKNKTNLMVNWPTANVFWNIDDLFALNPGFVPITLRVRLKKATEEGKVTIIGDQMNGKGRPKMVFGMSPVSNETRNAAKKAGIVLRETKTVSVADIKKPSVATTQSDIANTPALNVNPTKPVPA